jgi:hypothetical protein
MAGPIGVPSGNSRIDQLKPHFINLPNIRRNLCADWTGKIQSQQTAIERPGRAGEAGVLRFMREKCEELAGVGYGRTGRSDCFARGDVDEVRTTIGCRNTAIFLRSWWAEAE